MYRLDPPRSATFTPIFQSFINYRQVMVSEVLQDCQVELMAIELSKTGYDLNLDIIDDPQDCRVRLFARSDLYRKSEAAVLIHSYKKLLKAFSEEPSEILAKPDIYEQSDVQQSLRFGQGKFLNHMLFLAGNAHVTHRMAQCFYVASHCDSQN
jgi:hybrid polyketide synthase/nonribosomal peptide synthetase ACE1